MNEKIEYNDSRRFKDEMAQRLAQEWTQGDLEIAIELLEDHDWSYDDAVYTIAMRQTGQGHLLKPRPIARVREVNRIQQPSDRQKNDKIMSVM